MSKIKLNCNEISTKTLKKIGKSSEMMEGFCFVVSVIGLSMPNIEINYKRFGFMEHMIQLYNFILMNKLTAK
jgi:hypothetical protein